ncbi:MULTISPECIES: hypothetical protein [unclassified Lebetimonas]|uniref:hypothetical protein n=1 Tax=unclassified Lebetimonas TaxID=2648158 RepID=UPI0004667563|nr:MULTISPECIES: hypothetical protein [unclassified Lebetimonas]
MNLLRDLFDWKILKYTVLPFIISIIFWGTVFFLFKNLIYTFINSYILYLPFGEKLLIFLSNFIYFVPIVSIFGYTFQLIIMAHFVLKQCKGNR